MQAFSFLGYLATTEVCTYMTHVDYMDVSKSFLYARVDHLLYYLKVGPKQGARNTLENLQSSAHFHGRNMQSHGDSL